MSKPSKWRGWDIHFDGTQYVYSDNLQPVPENINRVCGNCGKPQTPEGHDGCLGTLPGVMNACCGHGIKREAYIQYRPTGDKVNENTKSSNG